MKSFKRLSGLAAAAIMATGLFASTAAPAEAAPVSDHGGGIHLLVSDTGWD